LSADVVGTLLVLYLPSSAYVSGFDVLCWKTAGTRP
jgi:hypothetical protein